MNETTNKSLPKSKFLSPGFRLWLKLVAAIFIITSGLVLIFLGVPHPHNRSAWLPVLAAMAAISLLAAAILSAFWLFIRWLGWRRVLFLLACLVTVIALFYAEEDWRGHHAWVQYRRAEAAKGAPFDWAAVVPPPVPDDQNFALTPVVASSYGQMLDRTGHEIRPQNDKLVNRLSMPYYGWSQHSGNLFTNGLYNWNLGKRTDLAAVQRDYRALAMETNLFPVPPQPQTPAADVLLALSRYDATLEELRQAAQLPYSRFPLEYDKEEPGSIILPHLAAVKSCAQMLSLRATAELQTGRSDQALADVQLVQRLTESVRTEPFIVSHLVRMVMVQLMLQPVWEGLADHRWSEAQLTGLDAGLAKLDFVADYDHSFRGVRAFMTDSIDYVRRHPWQYSNLRVVYGTDAPPSSGQELMFSLLMAGHLVPSGWFDQNGLGIDRTLDEYYLLAADVQKHTIAPLLVEQGNALLENERQHLTFFNAIECFMLRPVGKAARSLAYGQSSADLARVAVALERYRLAQGRYPEALAALAPKYMEQVPNDVIGEQPMHYRLTEDGQFVLYSVGWNGTDDGGVVGLTHGSTPQQDPSQGDWVWRYPQP